MTGTKYLGVAAIFAGLICCATAFENEAKAVNCEPAEPTDYATCKPPWVSGIHEYMSIGYCQSSYYFWCVPLPGSNCGQVGGYGVAHDSICLSDPNRSPPSTCTDHGGGSIPMNVPWYATDCMFVNGMCQCVYVVGGNSAHADQVVEKCNCSEGEL